MGALLSTDSKKVYTGDGVTTVFAFPFLYFDKDDLVVSVLDTTDVDAEAVVQTRTTNYTVETAGDSDGGDVTMIAVLTSDQDLIIERVVKETQESTYTNFNKFPATTVETGYNRLTMMIQQHRRELDLCLKFQTDIDPAVSSGTINDALIAGYSPRLKSDLSGLEWAKNVDGSNISLPAALKFMVQTAAGVFSAIEITAGAGISITSGAGQSGDTVITAPTSSLLKEYIYWASTGSPANNTGIVVYEETQVLNNVGSAFYEFQGDVTLDLTTTGAGALDTGSLANNTWYALVGIFDSNGVNNPSAMGVVLSDYDAGTVTMPGTHNQRRRLGTFLTNGSATIEELLAVSDGLGTVKHYPAAVQSVASITTLATVDFSSFCPPTCQLVEILIEGGAAGISNLKWEAVEYAGSVTTRNISGVFEGGAESTAVSVPLSEAQTTRFESSNVSVETRLHSYTDNITRSA